MNIIAVDDEILALELCRHIILEAMPDCTVSGFDTPGEALDYAKNNTVDIAFLDIEMSGMNGLQLAKELKDIYGRTIIIFVTGSAQYAADAFSLRAGGYLLKPISVQAVTDTIEHLRNPVRLPSKTQLQVRAFGNFEVFLDGKPFRFSRSKSKEIFAYLIYRNGASCTVRELAAALEDDSEKNMQTYISAMMKDLKKAGHDKAVIKRYNSIAADISKIDCDYYRFLKGDIDAVNAYMGEFMMQYSWAEFVTGYLDEKLQ